MHCGKWPHVKATETRKDEGRLDEAGAGRWGAWPHPPCAPSVWLRGARSSPRPKHRGGAASSAQSWHRGPGQSSREACTHRRGSRDRSPLFHPAGSPLRPTAEAGGTAGAGVSSGVAPVGRACSVGGTRWAGVCSPAPSHGRGAVHPGTGPGGVERAEWGAVPHVSTPCTPGGQGPPKHPMHLSQCSESLCPPRHHVNPPPHGPARGLPLEAA